MVRKMLFKPMTIGALEQGREMRPNLEYNKDK